jgi:hypothetical protein
MAWLTSPAGAFAKAGEDMQDGLGRKSHLLIATKSVTDLRAARRRLARCWSLRTDFLAGKLRPRSVDSRYRGVTRRRSRFVFFHFLGFGILRQHGRRQKGGDRTNEKCVCNPHVRFSFANEIFFIKRNVAIFLRRHWHAACSCHADRHTPRMRVSGRSRPFGFTAPSLEYWIGRLRGRRRPRVWYEFSNSQARSAL